MLAPRSSTPRESASRNKDFIELLFAKMGRPRRGIIELGPDNRSGPFPQIWRARAIRQGVAAVMLCHRSAKRGFFERNGWSGRKWDASETQAGCDEVEIKWAVRLEALVGGTKATQPPPGHWSARPSSPRRGAAQPPPGGRGRGRRGSPGSRTGRSGSWTARPRWFRATPAGGRRAPPRCDRAASWRAGPTRSRSWPPARPRSRPVDPDQGAGDAAARRARRHPMRGMSP